MTLLADISGDFALVCDGQETLTMRGPLARQSIANQSISNAAREQINAREMAASFGRYQAGDLAFTWPAGQATPQLGSRLVDATLATWTIINWEQVEMMDIYRAVARNLAIVIDLNQYINLQQNQPTKGAGGAAEPNWVEIQHGLLARVQPVTQVRSEQHGRISGTVEGEAYLQEQVIVDNTYRLEEADGTLWEVKGYRSPDTITDLFTIDLMRRL